MRHHKPLLPVVTATLSLLTCLAAGQTGEVKLDLPPGYAAGRYVITRVQERESTLTIGQGEDQMKGAALLVMEAVLGQPTAAGQSAKLTLRRVKMQGEGLGIFEADKEKFAFDTDDPVTPSDPMAEVCKTMVGVEITLQLDAHAGPVKLAGLEQAAAKFKPDSPHAALLKSPDLAALYVQAFERMAQLRPGQPLAKGASETRTFAQVLPMVGQLSFEQTLRFRGTERPPTGAAAVLEMHAKSITDKPDPKGPRLLPPPMEVTKTTAERSGQAAMDVETRAITRLKIEQTVTSEISVKLPDSLTKMQIRDRESEEITMLRQTAASAPAGK